MIIDLKSESDTINMGSKIGSLLPSNSLILLDGELGSGKTTFTKGIAKGLKIYDLIKSPTYTIVREYYTGRLPLFHIDAYRLENGGVDDLGISDYLENDGVVVIEWFKYTKDYLPSNYLMIKLNYTDYGRQAELIPIGSTYKKIIDKL